MINKIIMMENYFEIENLKCSYNPKDKEPKVVLEIEKLEIPRGKVVFIVGQSGCGKSTILETLGLMNNTLVCENNTKFVFTPAPACHCGLDPQSPIDCTKIWNKKNADLSKLRKEYFSFIFQNTNLMENFTIKENATIPQLIKGSEKKYVDFLKKVYDEKEIAEIQKKTDTKALSGGQKQRLAFVRAFLPNFNILFGDEPTGNLDPKNAKNLMSMVANEIKDTDKTAIIVSHSPELSVDTADIIIKIHKEERTNEQNETEYYGVINNDSTYHSIGKGEKKQWFFNDTEISKDKLKTIIISSQCKSITKYL